MAHMDLWLREIAPSDDLRKWFSDDSRKWEMFKTKYREELEEEVHLFEKLKDAERKSGAIVLLYEFL